MASRNKKVKNIDFMVDKTDLQQIQYLIKKVKKKSIKQGEILLKIQRLALTSNNITYAVLGDRIGYWNFFPGYDNWGRIPAWGFAKVIKSKHKSICKGERYYGYFPMSSHVVMQPDHITDRGFTDAVEHRKSLPPIYNNYHKQQFDKKRNKTDENIQALFRPLFLTSFLIDEFLAGGNFFGAENIILTSASSKTAILLAEFLKKRKKKNKLAINIIGLTSLKNYTFVHETRAYDQVLTYESCESLDPRSTSLIVDFTGNNKLQTKLKNHLKDYLKYNCLVGMVDWDQPKAGRRSKNPGTVFFAPDHAVEKIKELGQEEFDKRSQKAWKKAKRKLSKWLDIQEVEGRTYISKLYINVLKGQFSPKMGFIIRL